MHKIEPRLVEYRKTSGKCDADQLFIICHKLRNKVDSHSDLVDFLKYFKEVLYFLNHSFIEFWLVLQISLWLKFKKNYANRTVTTELTHMMNDNLFLQVFKEHVVSTGNLRFPSELASLRSHWEYCLRNICKELQADMMETSKFIIKLIGTDYPRASTPIPNTAYPWEKKKETQQARWIISRDVNSIVSGSSSRISKYFNSTSVGINCNFD